jgi:hypothetical protein
VQITSFFFLADPLGERKIFSDSKNDFKSKATMKKKRIDAAALLINLSFMQVDFGRRNFQRRVWKKKITTWSYRCG